MLGLHGMHLGLCYIDGRFAVALRDFWSNFIKLNKSHRCNLLIKILSYNCEQNVQMTFSQTHHPHSSPICRHLPPSFNKNRLDVINGDIATVYILHRDVNGLVVHELPTSIYLNRNLYRKLM